jgi:hypothetical protein
MSIDFDSSDFSVNFTVTNATGTGQVAVKIFTPLDEVISCVVLPIVRNLISLRCTSVWKPDGPPEMVWW